VLGEEPGLELTGADDSGDDQVIGAVVARPSGTGGVLVGVDENGFVNFQQPGQHGGDFLDAVRRAGDAGDLGDVTGVADSHPACTTPIHAALSSIDARTHQATARKRGLVACRGSACATATTARPR